MMLALWTAVTFFLPCAFAYSKAKFATRVEAVSVISFMLCTTPIKFIQANISISHWIFKQKRK